MEIRALLKEENSIKDKISKALKTLKEWFLNKISQIKDIFTSIKSKVTNKLKSIKSGAILSNDIIDRSGKKILSKGDSVNKAKGTINATMGEIKKTGDSTIKDCREGIQSLSDDDTSKAIEQKKDVHNKIVALTVLVGVLSAILGAHYLTDKSIERDEIENSANLKERDLKHKADVAKDKIDDEMEKFQTKKDLKQF